jgi:hypothetical protein
LKGDQGEGLFKNEIFVIIAKNSGGKASALLTGSFFGADFLIKEVTNLFDEDSGEIFVGAIGGDINLARVTAVATPKAGHVGSGKCANGGEKGKVGTLKGDDMLKGCRPI